MAVLLSTLTVMILGLSEASEMCGFNPLCTCRRFHHEVICRGVPFSEFPQLPHEGIYQVTVIRSGLESLPHNFLEGSSVASLHLMQNHLLHISPHAFSGLKNILTTLDLSHNALDDSSLSSLHPLSTLQWLNMEGNHLDDVSKWSQMGCRGTLNSLFLGSNHITHIPEGTFTPFENLNFLDVEGNLLHDVDSHSLPGSLRSLSLSNNILKKVPLHAIYSLKNLRYLYLSGNLFKELPCPFYLHTHRLERLELSNNLITKLDSCMFNGSFFIKEMHLDFNFIRYVSARCFKGTGLERLVLANNRIVNLHSDAFEGVEMTLKTLDMSFNLMEEFPVAVNNLKVLLYLSLKGNLLENIDRDDLQGFRKTLEVLDLSGNKLQQVPRLALRYMKKLVRLSLQDNRIRHVCKEDFEKWGESLTTLSLANNGITRLLEGSFEHLVKLKELKLSFNNILVIDSNVFEPLQKTLEVLDLSSAVFTSTLKVEFLLKNLKSLEWLQLDHNNISKVSSVTLATVPKLRHLDLSYNAVREIPIDFISSRHVYLNTLILSNNEIKTIKSGTFWEIPHMTTVVLFANKISAIEDYAFAHCTYLHTIVLSKNNITTISPSAFHNITRLSNLFLQDNRLETFSTDVIEGETAQLYLNLSSNALKELKVANSSTQSLRVRTLDLTNNQLSVIPLTFMTAISNHLLYMFLSKNRIENASFPVLPILQLLDLSCNRLVSIDDLRCCPTLQILLLNHNNISSLADGAFDSLPNLRVLDLSHNSITSLPQNHLFDSTLIERLNLSSNHLTELPAVSSKHVKVLDLSYNSIEHIPPSLLSNLTSLLALNLSSNRISSLQGEIFHGLNHLLDLDLSSNPLKVISVDTPLSSLSNLQSLRLCNSSLISINAMPLPRMRVLSLKGNLLANISQDVFDQCEQMRILDLSGNQLQDVPIHLWTKLRRLKSLDVSTNPVEVLGINSFSGLSKLQTLDISGLLLKRLDTRALHGLKFLLSLKTDSYASVRSFRLQDLLSQAPALRKVTVHVEESTLSHQVQRAFGTKLRELVITGPNLVRILPDAFAGLVTHKLTIRISGTLVSRFPDGLLRYLPDVRFLTLDLRNNRLTTMGPGVLAAVTKEGSDPKQTQHITGGVLLEENPWSCTCELLWLGRWLRRWLRETFHVHMLTVEATLYVNSMSRKATCSVMGTNVTLALIDLRKSDVDCNIAVSGAMNSVIPYYRYYYTVMTSVLLMVLSSVV